MANIGFTRKKVGSLTLGEKLKKIRSEYRISLNEVAKNTKIQMKYLEYLENGEYEKLPADVYVRGFVRSYANFLGTDESVLVKMYERERNIRKNLKKEDFQEQPMRTFHFPRFVVTPKLLIGTVIFLVAVGGFVYLYREFQAFASVPQLVIFDPADGQVIIGSETLVRGKTEKDASLVINGQPVLVRDNGEFSEEIRLQSGLNTLTVVATNKFKKEKSEVVSVQADYERQPFAEPGAGPDIVSGIVPVETKARFEVSVQGAPLKMTVSVDGNVVYNGALASDAKQTFEVTRELKISSEDGSRTLLRVGENGEPRPIGDTTDPVKDIVFTPENDGSSTE